MAEKPENSQRDADERYGCVKKAAVQINSIAATLCKSRYQSMMTRYCTAKCQPLGLVFLCRVTGIPYTVETQESE